MPSEPRPALPAPPAVLIVGAGSVGQVFGYHLFRGGAQVTFLVRPAHRAQVAEGFALYPLNRYRAGDAPLRFREFALSSSAAEVAAQRFAQVYLTVPSHGLRGPWLAELLAQIGDASLVSLQPDVADQPLLRAAGARAETLVQGGIALISYAAPLPGETRFPEPGTAYWLPPFARSPFSGPPARVQAVIDALRRGGLPAARGRDVAHLLAFPNAIGMTYLTALEAAGWSARPLVHGALAPLCRRAVREAIAVAQVQVGSRPLGVGLASFSRLLRPALWLAQRCVPFPLTAYLKQHFTKVGAQTRLMMAGLIARGRAAELGTAALEQLCAALPPPR
jgi:2-dehydropantoate 2-reductase